MKQKQITLCVKERRVEQYSFNHNCFLYGMLTFLAIWILFKKCWLPHYNDFNVLSVTLEHNKLHDWIQFAHYVQIICKVSLYIVCQWLIKFIKLNWIIFGNCLTNGHGKKTYVLFSNQILSIMFRLRNFGTTLV